MAVDSGSACFEVDHVGAHAAGFVAELAEGHVARALDEFLFVGRVDDRGGADLIRLRQRQLPRPQSAFSRRALGEPFGGLEGARRLPDGGAGLLRQPVRGGTLTGLGPHLRACDSPGEHGLRAGGEALDRGALLDQPGRGAGLDRGRVEGLDQPADLLPHRGPLHEHMFAL